MRVIYLYSGINNSTREVKVNLVPLANGGSFHLTTENGTKTNRMFVKANRALGKVIGIKEIQFSYQAKQLLKGSGPMNRKSLHGCWP